jgi:hypothetical protein
MGHTALTSAERPQLSDRHTRHIYGGRVTVALPNAV